MAFFDSLSAQMSEPSMLELLKRGAASPTGDRGSWTGAAANPEVRYAANVARRLALPGGATEPVVPGALPDQEARYAANVARRLAPAVGAAESVVSGVAPDEEARYAANVARRLARPVGAGEPVVSGAAPDQEARYAANVARRLGLPAVTAAQPVASGGIGDQEARYAANVARRLGPPMVAGPSPDAVESAIAATTRGYRPGVSPDEYGVGGPQSIESPPAPVDPSESAALKRKAVGPHGVVPGAVPGGVPMEWVGTAPPPSPELLAAAPEVLPMSGHTLGEAAAMQPAMGVAGPDFGTGAPAWQDPAYIRRQYGIGADAPPAVPQAGHGFLAHLKGALEGLGAGMATGHPIGGAIMGVAGGVNPQLGANAWYNNVTLPRWEAQQGQAVDAAAKRLAMGKSVAELTGIDPFTGKPSYAAQQAEVKSDLADQIAQATVAHRKVLEDISRQREIDMADVARGNLDIKEAIAREKGRTDQAMESLRQQLLKIQQQNADANTLRANKAGQPRTSITTKIWGPNPDHSAWEKERAEVLRQHPEYANLSNRKLTEQGLLRREPAPQIQTGSRTTRGGAQGPAVRPPRVVSGQGNRIPAQKQAVPASRLQEMLNHPDVKARGIKDINALRKDLANQGYTIDETK